MKNAQDEVNHLRSAMHELEATNQLLKDEYQTLQLTLNSAEQKLVEVQKENSQLVGQIMEFKDRDVLRLNQENDRAMRLQQERIKKQLEEAVAEKCRGTIELVGMARDRRTLNFMEEVLQPENCKTLMCFICNSKHIYYHGLDAFGEEYNAGCIDYRNKDQDRAHLRNLFASACTGRTGRLPAPGRLPPRTWSKTRRSTSSGRGGTRR